MIRHLLFTNSITRYFAVTFAATVAVAMLLFHLISGFTTLGDDDDQRFPEEIRQGSLLASIARILDAAPSDLRETLAKAAGTGALRVDLYHGAPPPTADEAVDRRKGCAHRMEALPARENGSVLISHAGFALADADGIQPSCTKHPRAVQTVALHDGSSVVFMAYPRAWDIGRWNRILFRIIVASVSIAVVSFVGARRLARPIDAFADAARRFGTDPNAPPMAEQGPIEMRLAIAAFNTMQSQIKRFVSGQVSMFAAISHDLRTPLTRMRLRGEFITDQEQQARLFRDVDDMQSMVDAALAFLRDNAAEEETTSLDLAELLRTIADDYADMGHDVAYAGPDHLAFPGRPVGLKRAFGNLVDNAVKYGVRPAIDLRSGAGDVVVTVSDQGPGIPADALEDVFTPFQRVEPSRNRHTGGIGLGLAAARAGFRAHGGDVVLTNGVDRGFCAAVTLPASR